MDFFDTRQLRAFHALAQTRSFTLAAKRLFLTQSAISHSIKALEESLNCRLFDRVGKTISLTAEGEALLRHAKVILHAMEVAAVEVSEIRRWGQGRLRVGATVTICHYLLPKVLREFRESFPKCEISIEPGDTAEILESLLRGDLDLAIGIKSGTESSLEFLELFTDELAFVYSPMHKWAQKPKINGKELSSERFIVYGRTSPTLRIIKDHFAKSRIPLITPLELRNMEAIKEFAKIGYGVGIMAPWVARKELEDGSLLTRPIGEGSLVREWGIFSRKGRELSLACESFAGIFESVAAQPEMHCV